MGDFLNDYADKFMDVIELSGDSTLEKTAKEMVRGFARSAVLAQKIQALNDSGDAEIASKATALTELALKFNKAFPSLDDDQKQQIESIVGGIVTGDDELDAEAWFDSALDGVQLGQKYATEANALLALTQQ